MNMMFVFLIIYALYFAFNLMLNISNYNSRKNPVPANVVTLYSKNKYEEFQKYTAEKTLTAIIFSIIRFIIVSALIFGGVLADLSSRLPSNIYVNSLLVLLIFMGVDFICEFAESYIMTMRIDEKFGFNKQSFGSFCIDMLKSVIIQIVLYGGLMCLFILLYQSLHDYILIVFALILIAIILFISFLSPYLQRIFNKFEKLPEGSLRTRLTALLNDHGFNVRDIEVMKASEKTTRTNAYFTGFGKLKTIVLYDNLINSMSEDEILAVFAHEMGHGIHKDTLKMQIQSFLLIAIITILIWLTVRYGKIYTDFNFTSVNYGFAFILLMEIEVNALSPLFGIATSFTSRKAEYRADAQAVKEGYGSFLISALKKLAKENLANLAPNKLNILLEYDHPTISQRIDAIEKEMDKQK